MNRKGEIPLAAVERILRNAESEIRVSESAKEALANILEKVGNMLATEAVKECEHAKRVTIKAEDIKRANEILKIV